MSIRFKIFIAASASLLTSQFAIAQDITLNSYSNQTEITASRSITLTDGFYIPSGSNVRIYTLASFQSCTPFAWSPTTSQNFVRSRIFKVAGVNSGNINDSRNVCEVNQTVQYYDGLGRAMQQITVQGSPSFRDVVQPAVYDAFGREVKKYLPYVSSLLTSNGSFKTAAITDQTSFYNNPSSYGATGVATITNAAFAETKFEPSPLNRIEEQGAAGASWQLSTGHTAKITYGANNTSTSYSTTGFAVRQYNAVPSVVSGREYERTLSGIGYYAVNQLTLTISKDENWVSGDGKAGTLEEYKDKEGRLVLKRLFNKDAGGNIEVLSTYYVYDDLGNLSFVLPPAVDPDAASVPGSTALNDFCYQYRYDGRKRLIEKKLPGKGWEHMVYNKLNQMVLSQDSIQRANNQWSFVKYDALGRTVITGLMGSSTVRATWQSSINGQSVLWEGRDNANASGTGTGYTNATLPTSSISAYHSVSYYDDYAFYGNSFSGLSGVQSTAVRGMSTGSKVNVLGSSTMLLSTIYYDEDGRAIQTKSQNNLSGTDVVDNTYNFAGELTASTRTHVVGGNTTTVATRFDYDHMGRKLATMESINGATEVVLSKLSYNELGQLQKKELHSTDGGSSFLQNTAYAYNERGWLKGSSSDQFSMKLKYDDGTVPQYNGNIANQDWGSGVSFPNVYTYGYDKLNRLLSGSSTGVAMAEVLTYDVMGNIKTMNRDAGGAGTYNYTGNQLTSITSGPLATGTYVYNGNGNATTDGRTGVVLTYNVLNLPATATKSGLSLAYTYDASGNKLKKVSNGVTRDYVGGIEYNGSTIDIIPTGEGIARNNSGVYSYEYNLSDHLGNVRYSFHKNPSSGLLERLQSDDYYAFGKRKSGSPVSVNNKYLYNGKEVQDELGEQYDYGARFYDPIVGRWNVVDPMAEMSRRWSPFTYGKNNPIIMIDPDGMFDVKINGSEANRAKDELQKSVKGELNLNRDEKTGNISYTQVEGVTLSDNTKQLKNAIDDHSVVVDVNASNNTKDIVGGGFSGNTVTKGADGKNSVVANQEINPGVLGAADSYYGKPGQNTLHEITEAYHGGKLAQASGVSTPAGKNAIYDKAHGELSVKQAGPITSKVTDAEGNFLSKPYKNPSWVVWLVSDGIKEPMVIQQLPVPKQ